VSAYRDQLAAAQQRILVLEAELDDARRRMRRLESHARAAGAKIGRLRRGLVDVPLTRRAIRAQVWRMWIVACGLSSIVLFTTELASRAPSAERAWANGLMVASQGGLDATSRAFEPHGVVTKITLADPWGYDPVVRRDPVVRGEKRVRAQPDELLEQHARRRQETSAFPGRSLVDRFDCRKPYVIGRAGIRHLRRECL
jgi:hypothetical protein